jgi:hypothetical protein
MPNNMVSDQISSSVGEFWVVVRIYTALSLALRRQKGTRILRVNDERIMFVSAFYIFRTR